MGRPRSRTLAKPSSKRLIVLGVILGITALIVSFAYVIPLQSKLVIVPDKVCGVLDADATNDAYSIDASLIGCGLNKGPCFYVPLKDYEPLDTKRYHLLLGQWKDFKVLESYEDNSCDEPVKAQLFL